MALFKQEEERAILREAGRRLAVVLDAVSALVAPGVSTALLDEEAERLIRAGGDRPAFLGYTPSGAKRPFPATLCVSVNDEIVHGISNENPQTLHEGDIVGLDIGLVHRGIFVDMARTVGVGSIDKDASKLIKATEAALRAGIAAARPGGKIGDISAAVEKVGRESGFGIVRELGGHGVGHAVHEAPYIPNVGERGTGATLSPGMAICIEPMLNEGSRFIKLAADGYTYKTKDGKRSAHFEHTILITESGNEVVTRTS